MKIPSLAALLIAAAAVPVLASDFNTDASALLAQAREAAKKDSSVVRPLGTIHYEPACAEIKFMAGQPMTSDSVSLDSDQWENVCTPMGDHEDCHDEPVGPTSHKDVRLTLQNRPALQPGEVDKFEVCLTGSWLTTDVVSSAYDYKVTSDGSKTGEIVLTAVKKKAAAK